MARNKGPGYKPDPFYKAVDGFMKKLVHPQEKAIYAIAIILVAVLIVAWVAASFRRSSTEDALNALAAARKSEGSAIEDVLRAHASVREMVPYILQQANEEYLNSMLGAEDTDKGAGLGKAEEFYRMIDNHNPEHPLAFLAFAGIGCCREESGDSDGAIKYFRKAHAAAPHEMKGKFAYDTGRTLYAAGRKEEAVKHLKDATLGEKVYDANIPGGDYEWRLNARQLLAEIEDEEGAQAPAPTPDAGGETPGGEEPGADPAPLDIPDEPDIVVDDALDEPVPLAADEVVE